MKNSLLTKRQQNIRRVAFSGLLSSLAFLFMLVGAVTDILDLSMFIFASLCIVFAVIELGPRWSLLIWSVTSCLSLLLLPSKAAALIFLFGGIYPLAKAYLERLPRALAWLLKLALFNLLLTAFLFILNRVLGLTDAGYAFTLLEYVMGNGAFILYDICLTACITVYLLRLRRRIRIRGLRDDS